MNQDVAVHMLIVQNQLNIQVEIYLVEVELQYRVLVLYKWLF